jgi:superfamily II DNA or RNA helicase
MRMEIDNVYTKVSKFDEAEQHWLLTYLAFEDVDNPGAKISLFNAIDCSFPSGLVPMAVKGAERQGFAVDIMDKRQVPCVPDANADIDWLRWYQKEAVACCVHTGHGIVDAPTGSGKTEIFAGLVKSLPCKWLFLVYRNNLVSQAADRYEKRTGEKAFIWKAGDSLPPKDTRVVLTTFQTLFAGLKRRNKHAISILLNAEGIIIDECHTVPAASFYKVVINARNAYYRFGLSGTPLARGDQKSLMAIAGLGSVIYKIKSKTLIEEGVLAKPIIRMQNFYEECNAKTWPGVYSKSIVRSKKRNSLIVHIVKKATYPCLVFVRDIKHGETLQKMLEKEGFAVDFVWGKKDEAQRDRVVKRLEYGETEVCVSSVVFQEGVDIPILASVVLAGAGKSIIATLQNIGRGMRTNDGLKMEFEVWDVNDLGNRTLEKHSRARRRTYMQQGYEISMLDEVPPTISSG